ncbi:MAG: hypothetical protein ABSG76_24840, partial [Xanthobacteraceae bacterium]
IAANGRPLVECTAHVPAGKSVAGPALAGTGFRWRMRAPGNHANALLRKHKAAGIECRPRAARRSSRRVRAMPN